MPVKQAIPFSFGTFFTTFTCYKWLPLIEKVKGYDIIYNWFDHLKKQGHFINGYVPIAFRRARHLSRDQYCGNAGCSIY